MNSRTFDSISWYLPVVEYICWKMVVTLPKIVAYNNAVIHSQNLYLLNHLLQQNGRN